MRDWDVFNQNYDKRVELFEYIESLGIKFDSKLGDKALLVFWSGDYKEYKSILDQKLSENNKVSVFEDVSGFDFMYKLSSELLEQSKNYPSSDTDIINKGVQTLGHL